MTMPVSRKADRCEFYLCGMGWKMDFNERKKLKKTD